MNHFRVSGGTALLAYFSTSSVNCLQKSFVETVLAENPMSAYCRGSSLACARWHKRRNQFAFG